MQVYFRAIETQLYLPEHSDDLAMLCPSVANHLTVS